MTTLASPYPRTRKSVPMAPVVLALLASSGFKCQNGSLVLFDPLGGTTSGKAIKSDASSGFAGLGHLAAAGSSQALVDNTANATPAPVVQAATGIWEVAHAGNLDGTEPLGTPLYAVDDNTCDKSDRNGTLPLLGTLVRHVYDSLGNYTNMVEVAIFPPLYGAGQIITIKKRILAPGLTQAGAVVLSAAALTETIALGTLPPNCRLLGGAVDVDQAFAGGSIGSCTLKVNGNSATSIINAADLTTTTGFPAFAPAGAEVTAGNLPQMGGVALTATVTTTTHNVSTMTAGKATLRLHFLRAA
jgi:hypothetical protein